MKTDRRGFLRALVGSLAASAAAPAVRPTAAETYENDVLRMSLEKPRGWKFIDRLEWSLKWSDVRYESEDLPEELLKELLGQPLFVMARADLDRTDVSPNVSLWPEVNMDLALPLTDAHWEYVDAASEIMKRFRLLEPPAAATLGGIPASRMRLRYFHETGSEGSALCEVEHYLVKRGEVFLGINFGRAAEGHSREVLEELESVRDSVAFWA